MKLFDATKRISGWLAVIALTGAVAGGAAVGESANSLITGSVSDGQRITLTGHVKPMVRTQLDGGAVSASMPMPELQFIFKRSPAQDKSLEKLLADQQDTKSAQYHRWLTPSQFGSKYGASSGDIATAAAWLRSKGFAVGAVPSGHGYLPFAGTAAQVQDAFQTPIHYFNAGGKQHYAAVTEPSIPAAFENLVAAVAGLHNFYPEATISPARESLGPTYTAANGNHFVGPPDVATLYNLSPLYQDGINGAGVTVAIIGESDIEPSVVTGYWSAFGVNQNQQLSSIAVPTSAGGSDPGITNDGNETEAYLDLEIVGGLAPSANIVLVRDESLLTASQYVVDQNLASVMNLSFSNCEYNLGNDGNSAIQSTFKQAASQGMTVTVSTGDAGIATCDQGLNGKAGEGVETGLSVNGYASTPYTVAVGGTDFNITLSQNWSASNSPGSLSSALSYIPEAVWNDSCANPLFVTKFASQSGAQTALGLCNSQFAASISINVIGGEGSGLSSCSSLTASGNCQSGYAQPSWQSGVDGIQQFGARALPDVSLLADNWLNCDQTVNSCAPGHFKALAGTSAAAPTMAAITVLLNQALGGGSAGRQGNLNPLLYFIGNAQYGSATTPNSAVLSSCNASNGQNIASNCVFNDITAGNNAQPCSVGNYSGDPTGSVPAGTCSSSNGDALGIVVLNGVPAYSAGPGYDLATGLGSINGNNFLVAVYGLEVPPQGLKGTANGNGVALTWTADSFATAYDIFDATSSGAEGNTPALSDVSGTSTTVTGLSSGQTYYFTIAGVTAYGVSVSSNEVQVTLAPAAPTGVSASGTMTSVQLSWSASNGATSYNVYQGSSAGGEASSPVASGLTATSYSVSGSRGQKFYFKVAAVNGGGVSALSSETNASVTSPPASHGGGGAMSPTQVLLGAAILALQLWRQRRRIML